MPKRGHAMPAHHSARHAQAMRAPLVAVVETTRDAQIACWREVLACGHAGQWVSQPWGDWKPRRRCQHCAEAATAHAGEK